MIKYSIDSRKIKPGQVFVAIKGYTVDGHKYVKNALEAGASYVVVEEDVDVDKSKVIKVNNTLDYLKENLKKDYANELNELKIIGITGTNGKTTTAYLTYQMLESLKIKSAYLGTLGFISKDKTIITDNTTPEISTIYELLMEAKEMGYKVIVMEVSSHALDMNRLYGLHIDIGAFTNLTEDHLDYHKTMDNYLKAKLKILNLLSNNGTFIINNDDEYSKYFKEKYKNTLSIGFSNSDYLIKNAEINPAETKINFNYQNKDYKVTTNLTSKFNVYNYMTALAIVNQYGFNINDIIKINIKAPKGRCETHKVKNAYAVIDYAHTPDAVEKVINAYNELKKKRVITIVGCGGDRDPLKRPIMGNIATTLSDYTILTSDNPRTEDPKKIIDDIVKGVKTKNYEVIEDRKTAIKKGLDMLEDEDILLILGKGHEDYQIIGREKIHLDDAEEVENYKKKLDK